MIPLRPRSLQLNVMALALAATLNLGCSTVSATPSQAAPATIADGRLGGAATHFDRLEALRTHVYNISFRGDAFAEIAVSGDGDTDLDLYVYDEFGHLVASDVDATDDCYVSWTPVFTGSFRVEVRNEGYVYNEYVLATN
jgi:hypothetical protein